MKTKSDLNVLIPDLVELVRNNNHEIGGCEYDCDENGACRCDDPIENYVCYEQGGWTIEVIYGCCGEWDSDDTLHCAWGHVTEIIASHYDDATGELSEFSDEDFDDLMIALNDELSDIA